MPDGNEAATTRGPVPVTVTVVVALAVPPMPLAVNVYVVDFLGETLTLPAIACEPTPLSMVTVAALTVDHDRVADPPAVIVEGAALKLMIDGGGVPDEVRVMVKENASPGS
jgi:hypothetical protein